MQYNIVIENLFLFICFASSFQDCPQSSNLILFLFQISFSKQRSDKICSLQVALRSRLCSKRDMAKVDSCNKVTLGRAEYNQLPTSWDHNAENQAWIFLKKMPRLKPSSLVSETNKVIQNCILRPSLWNLPFRCRRTAFRTPTRAFFIDGKFLQFRTRVWVGHFNQKYCLDIFSIAKIAKGLN